MSKPAFNIALLGMTPRNISTLTYFVEKYAGQHFNISSADDADVCILDFDVAAGVNDWHKHNLNAKPSIILSDTDPLEARTIWVKKPINADSMLTAINQLVGLVQDEPGSDNNLAGSREVVLTDTDIDIDIDETISVVEQEELDGYKNDFNETNSPNLTLSSESIIRCCGKQPDLDPKSQLFLERVTFHYDDCLLGQVKKAIKLAVERNVAVELLGIKQEFIVAPGGEHIFVDLSNRFIQHHEQLQKMLPKSQQKKLTLKTLSLSKSDFYRKYPKDHQFMQSSQMATWQITLWASQGRLPISIMPDTPVLLSGWPNFTRLAITPHAIAIAAAMMSEPASPLEVAEKMQIPQRYVFAFIAACESLDLIKHVQVASKQKRMFWRKPRGALKSILRSLKTTTSN